MGTGIKNVLMATVICVTAGISMPVAAQEPNCKEPQTQADMTICAGKDYEKADKQLNVEYQKLRKLLTERDKAADADGKGAADGGKREYRLNDIVTAFDVRDAQTGRDDFRLGEADGGDGGRVKALVVTRDDFGHDLALS
mgnify:CR=1 FL=1